MTYRRQEPVERFGRTMLGGGVSTGGGGDLNPKLLGLAQMGDVAGLVVQTAADEFATRSVVAGSDAVVVTNGDGVAGDITVDVVEAEFSGIPQSAIVGLEGDLAARQPLDATLSGLAGMDETPGVVVYTSGSAFVKRSIVAGSSAVTVQDGGGDEGNIIIDVDESRFSGIPQSAIVWPPSAGGDHNDLGGLQGGSAGQYYHLTSEQLGYVNDVPDKQPLDATLTSLAGLDASAGLVAQTGADTFTKRSVTSTDGTLAITNPAGVAGDVDLAVVESAFSGIPQSAIVNLSSDLAGRQPLDATLSALAGLDATAGLVTQVGEDSFVRRSVVAGSGAVTVSNGDGVDGNITIDVDESMFSGIPASAIIGGGAGADTLYVRARSEDVSNGFGLMGTNYNFTSFTFDPVDRHGGAGSFSTMSGTLLTTDELIPVDPEGTYALSMWLKATSGESGANGAGIVNVGIVAFDVDGLPIYPQHYLRFAGSALTTLAADLDPGDASMTLADATGWSAAYDSRKRHMAWFPYADSFGHTYPDYVYTRYTSADYDDYTTPGLWAADGISGNVVTFTSVWQGPALSAGTKVANFMAVTL